MTSQNAREKFTNLTLNPLECTKSLFEIAESVARVVMVVDNLSLTADEVLFLTSKSAQNRIEFNKISLADLIALEKYQGLRDSGASRELLLNLLRWLSTSSAQLNATEIPQCLASSFGWSINQTTSLLEAKYPGIPYDQIVDHLHN